MRLRHAALAAAVACLLPTLAACGDNGTVSQAGDVVPARQAKQFLHAKTSTVATPIGTLQVHAGKPLEKVPAGDTRELTAQTAPAGTTYLPITWRYDEKTTNTYADYIETSELPVVDLHSGDGSYRLPTPDPAQGVESFYVLVAKSAEHPVLDVAFDGVTQTVDLVTGKRHAGRARALYKLSHERLRPKKCSGKVTWSEIARAAQTCRITGPFLLPYAGGQWARPGHQWLVMSVATVLTTYLQAGTAPGSAGIYTPLSLKTTYRLGRHKPAMVLTATDGTNVCPESRTGDCNSHAYLVFDDKGSSTTLSVTGTYKMVLVRGYGGFDGKKSERVKESSELDIKRPR
jgi:hypothetical protein